MKDIVSIETPFSSAGLTSATQIIDVTTNVIFALENSSSAIPEPIFLSPPKNIDSQ